MTATIHTENDILPARRVSRASGGYFLHGETDVFVATPITYAEYHDVPAHDRVGGTRAVTGRGWMLRREGTAVRDGQVYPTLRSAAEFVGAWYGRG